MDNVLELRRQLTEAGLDYYGEPSAIVAVKMGTKAWRVSSAAACRNSGCSATSSSTPLSARVLRASACRSWPSTASRNVTDAVSRIKAARLEAEIELATMDDNSQAIRAVA
jgi:hypothetical protein